jgi:hypothetical protein
MSRIDVLRPFIEKNRGLPSRAGDAGRRRKHLPEERDHAPPARCAMPLLQFSAVLVSGMKKRPGCSTVNGVNAAELGIRCSFEDLVIAAWEVPADTLVPPVHRCVPPLRGDGGPARHDARPEAGRKDRTRRRGR